MHPLRIVSESLLDHFAGFRNECCRLDGTGVNIEAYAGGTIQYGWNLLWLVVWNVLIDRILTHVATEMALAFMERGSSRSTYCLGDSQLTQAVFDYHRKSIYANLQHYRTCRMSKLRRLSIA